MKDDRKELKRIFNERLNTICFDDYIDNRLAGDFIYKLIPLLTLDAGRKRQQEIDDMWDNG